MTESIGPIRPVSQTQKFKEALREAAPSKGVTNRAANIDKTTEAAKAGRAQPSPITVGPVTAALALNATGITKLQRAKFDANIDKTGFDQNSSATEEAKFGLNLRAGTKRVSAMEKKQDRQNRTRRAFEFAFTRLDAEEHSPMLPQIRPKFFAQTSENRLESLLLTIIKALIKEYKYSLTHDRTLDDNPKATENDFINWLADLLEVFDESIDVLAKMQLTSLHGSQPIDLEWVAPAGEALAATLQFLGRRTGLPTAVPIVKTAFTPNAFTPTQQGNEKIPALAESIRKRVSTCKHWPELLAVLSQIRMFVVASAT